MPIIESLLDIDFYKFTMGQFVFHRYPYVPVKYAFRCRTKNIRLADFIGEGDLRDELDYARTLRFNNSDLHYLRGTNEYGERMFREDYLEFLRRFRLPEYSLRKVDGMYELEFPGTWNEAIYWETIALSIVNELYYRALMKQMTRFQREVVYATGIIRLTEKIRVLRDRPAITFCDFGTRRRFSKEWQSRVVGILKDELPVQFLGTSNVKLAHDHWVLPMGTSAHELFMVMASIMHGNDDEILASQNKVLNDWWDEYGWGLSIALSDTFGSDAFFRSMTEEQARLWKGVRQDSGDPYEFAGKAVAFYKRNGIDSKEKLCIFSDGLDVWTIVNLYVWYGSMIKCTFGWGTNLTNDLGFDPLSLVVKVVEAGGHKTVKLSDNLAKATGSPEDIERFKKIFGYTGGRYKECKY